MVVGGLRVAASAQIVEHGTWWLAPVLVALARLPRGIALLPLRASGAARCSLLASAIGLVLFVAQALGIGLRGWTRGLAHGRCSANWRRARSASAPAATLVLIALLSLLSIGLALRGAFGGDAFVAGAVTTVAASILLFTAWPILRILVQAFQDGDGVFVPALLIERLSAEKIWSLRCLAGGGRCGVAWNTLFLALCCGAGTTALGLAFALIATRTGFALQEDAARADGAADHHAALRDRPGADPGVRPLRPGQPVPRLVDGRRRRRAGSTASRACCWRSSSPSRRSPSWC